MQPPEVVSSASGSWPELGQAQTELLVEFFAARCCASQDRDTETAIFPPCKIIVWTFCPMPLPHLRHGSYPFSLTLNRTCGFESQLAGFESPVQRAPALPEVKAHAAKMAIHRCARHCPS
eukprot:5852464-Amphidinium_carterae.1